MKYKTLKYPYKHLIALLEKPSKAILKFYSRRFGDDFKKVCRRHEKEGLGRMLVMEEDMMEFEGQGGGMWSSTPDKGLCQDVVFEGRREGLEADDKMKLDVI